MDTQPGAETVTQTLSLLQGKRRRNKLRYRSYIFLIEVFDSEVPSISCEETWILNNHEVIKRSFAEGGLQISFRLQVLFACDNKACVHAVLDGNQVLDFLWTDPIDAMKRSVAKLQYKDKLYTTFRPGTSVVPN